MMKLRILDKHSKWWKGEKGVTWALKNGEDWLLFKPKEEKQKTTKEMSSCVFPFSNENRFTKIVNSLYFLMMCFWAGMLGVSLALNIVLYFHVKELQSNLDKYELRTTTNTK